MKERKKEDKYYHHVNLILFYQSMIYGSMEITFAGLLTENSLH